MADILEFISLKGHTYSDKNGIVNIYTPDGKKPPRRIIFALLRNAYKQLLEDGK
jgi:hypothetical protein